MTHRYFRLSATASSSQRLLFSFSAWPVVHVDCASFGMPCGNGHSKLRSVTSPLSRRTRFAGLRREPCCPRKLLRKRLKFVLKPLGAAGTRLFLERRTRGVLSALSIGLFEELRRMVTGDVLIHLPELPLIECFEYTLDRANGVEQISVQGVCHLCFVPSSAPCR